MRFPRPAPVLAPLVAAGAPVAGWEVTAGLLAVLLTVTACLIVLVGCFVALTPQRRQDVIELIRVCRAVRRGERQVEAQQPALGESADE